MARKRVARVEIWHSEPNRGTHVAFIRQEGDTEYHYGPVWAVSDASSDRLDRVFWYGESKIIAGRTIYVYADRLSVMYNIDLDVVGKERRRWLRHYSQPRDK